MAETQVIGGGRVRWKVDHLDDFELPDRDDIVVVPAEPHLVTIRDRTHIRGELIEGYEGYKE